MRKSKAETASSRRQIVAEAARLFRERGPDRVSVAEIMQAVGMTHGGFYKHFASKDALLVAAIGESFAEKLDLLAPQSGLDSEALIDRYIRRYLTLEHVSHLATGCPIAGMTVDALRADTEAGDALAEGAESTIARFATASGGNDGAVEDAVRALTSMIGAVILARAVRSPDVRKMILETTLNGIHPREVSTP